jgi:hypothetical protein
MVSPRFVRPVRRTHPLEKIAPPPHETGLRRGNGDTEHRRNFRELVAENVVQYEGHRPFGLHRGQMRSNRNDLLPGACVPFPVADGRSIRDLAQFDGVEDAARPPTCSQRVVCHVRGDGRRPCGQATAPGKSTPHERHDDLLERGLHEVLAVVLPAAKKPIQGRVNHRDEAIVKLAGHANVALYDSLDQGLVVEATARRRRPRRQAQPGRTFGHSMGRGQRRFCVLVYRWYPLAHLPGRRQPRGDKREENRRPKPDLSPHRFVTTAEPSETVAASLGTRDPKTLAIQGSAIRKPATAST